MLAIPAAKTFLLKGNLPVFQENLIHLSLLGYELFENK